MEIWTVRNTGSDPKMPVSRFPFVQVMVHACRDKFGQFNGPTEFHR